MALSKSSFKIGVCGMTLMLWRDLYQTSPISFWESVVTFHALIWEEDKLKKKKKGIKPRAFATSLTPVMTAVTQWSSSSLSLRPWDWALWDKVFKPCLAHVTLLPRVAPAHGGSQYLRRAGSNDCSLLVLQVQLQCILSVLHVPNMYKTGDLMLWLK